MKATSPVVMLEFNELCPALLDRFMAEDRLPGFKRLYGQSQVFTTTARERGPHLDPWIQWITVHSGVNYDRHRVELLGKGHTFAGPRVWDLLSKAGLKVWVCGSMSVNYHASVNGHVLPDPWTVDPPPFPADYFEPYLKFVRGNVLEHTSGRTPIGMMDRARFLSYMASHGLSTRTCAAVVKQLVSERFKHDHWKRASLLDRLQCDLFCHVYRKERPDFSTLFLNSTAHMQHSYWRNMQPELFKLKPTAAEQDGLANAVLYGYQQMDRVVSRLLCTLGPDCNIVLCSALSQQPCLLYEDAGGKTAYRPRDFSGFLRFAGIDAPCKVQPVMAHEFHLQFEREADAADAVLRLSKLQFDDGTCLLKTERDGSAVFCGCAIFRVVPADAHVRIDGTTTSLPFDALLYRCVGLKSGMHHPDGVLWIRRRGASHQVHPERVPLDCVSPTSLALFGQPTPAYMSGHSLIGARQPVKRVSEAAA
jgi:hypothetical protein